MILFELHRAYVTTQVMFKISCGLGLSVLMLASTVWSKDDDRGEAVSFYIENDSTNLGGPGSDQAYSNGFKLSYISAEDHVPRWATPLISWSEHLSGELKKSKTNFGVSFGQQIYTPGDTFNPSLIPNDRPYAAWLNVGFMANFRTEAHSQVLELNLGVVGPSARGEDVQNGYHKLIRYPIAAGWSNQLHDEATIQINYQQRVKFWEMRQQNQKYFDLIPYYGASLGNVNVGANVGGIVRFGLNLPDDFGPTRPSANDGDAFIVPGNASEEVSLMAPSLYIFAGGRGIAVAKNIFLDGNTFRSSHRVKKYPINAETEFGFGTQFQKFSVVWRFVSRSPEFEERSAFNSFASLSVTYSNPNW